ncbi:hypothetical protein [Gulbenkiania mobilis]|uniref:hypothetical protein n=1 Tax=Gulbenkiania mobilis TaxID=397457 RepID=UPI0006BBEF1E|nr:hypothetical protein [Gulbenkiania mobilis]
MHNMAYVQKSAPAAAGDVISRSDAKLLHKYWNTPPAERDPVLLKEVGRVLGLAIDRKCWIRCDCGTGAVMYPSKMGDGTIKLSRMSNHPAHSDDCSFGWNEGELGGIGSRGGESTKPKVLPGRPDFLLYKAAQIRASAGEGESAGGRARNSGVRQAKLQTFMFWLLKQAGLDYLQRSDEPHYLRIKAVVATIEVVPDVTLGSLIWFSPRAIEEKWVHDRLKRLTASEHWPANVPPQGFLMVTVPDFSVHDRRLTLNSGTAIQIEGALDVYGRSGSKGHPYLALVSFRLDGGILKFVSAYLHPVLSLHEWLPVDSNWERETCGVIRKFLLATSQQGAKYRLQKPLEDIDVAGCGCRPDFIVWSGERTRLLIETMGSVDPEYLSQKQRTHQHMNQLGQLVKDDRAGNTKSACDELLKKRLWRWHFTVATKE